MTFHFNRKTAEKKKHFTNETEFFHIFFLVFSYTNTF